MTDYPCNKFDDCNFSRFGSIARTHRQTRMIAIFPQLSSSWVKTCDSQGSAVTYCRWGGQIYNLLVWRFLKTPCTKNYWNRFTVDTVILKNKNVTVFLRHSVDLTYSSIARLDYLYCLRAIFLNASIRKKYKAVSMNIFQTVARYLSSVLYACKILELIIMSFEILCRGKWPVKYKKQWSRLWVCAAVASSCMVLMYIIFVSEMTCVSSGTLK